jgi:hypothetical protein
VAEGHAHQLIDSLVGRGGKVNVDALSRLSPYRTEHINRFRNNYTRMPEPLEQNLGLSLSPLWRDAAICVFFTRILTADRNGRDELYPVAAFSRAVVDSLREVLGQGKRAQWPRF